MPAAARLELTPDPDDATEWRLLARLADGIAVVPADGGGTWRVQAYGRGREGEAQESLGYDLAPGV